MKQKRLLTLLIGALLLILCMASASAQEVIPYAHAGNSASISFNITDGVVSASGRCTSVNPNNTTKVTVYIQRLSGSDWVNIKSASSSDGFYAAKATYTATKGTTYRGKTVGKVYDSSGNLVDTLTIISNSKTY